jgi:hypothetical protein
MIKKYLDFVNERLGVPEGNIEGAESIYKFVLDKLSEKGDSIISENELVEVERLGSELIKLGVIKSIKVGDLEFKNIKVSIMPYFNDSRFEIIGMSVAIEHTDNTPTSLLFDKNKISNIDIMIRYAVIENKTTYKDIYNNFIKDKSEKIGSLSHEIKHIYDKYMFGKEMFGDAASYQTFTNKRFGIDTIDRFIYLLYLTSKTENLVRSSEIAGEIKSLEITKDDFKEFLESTRLYNNIKMSKDFSFEKMKKDLYNEVDLIKRRLKENGIDTPDNDDDIVDLILELTYKNIIGGSIENLSNMMNLNNPIKQMLGLIEKEEEEYFNKYIKKTIFENKEKYFEYCEKMINFEANKVLKKISKLYDMCEDKEVNKLQSKITDKSIINPKAHDKFVADKSIKNYESYFPKK